MVLLTVVQCGCLPPGRVELQGQAPWVELIVNLVWVTAQLCFALLLLSIWYTLAFGWALTSFARVFWVESVGGVIKMLEVSGTAVDICRLYSKILDAAGLAVGNGLAEEVPRHCSTTPPGDRAATVTDPHRIPTEV